MIIFRGNKSTKAQNLEEEIPFLFAFFETEQKFETTTHTLTE